MRRAFAAALVLLLTGAPVVAAACALACPAPASTSVDVVAMASDMSADCAAMHHAGAGAPLPDGRPAATESARQAPMPGCCTLNATPADAPPASLDHAAPIAAAAPPVATVVALRVATVAPARRSLAPPGSPHERARRTDILRL